MVDVGRAQARRAHADRQSRAARILPWIASSRSATASGSVAGGPVSNWATKRSASIVVGSQANAPCGMLSAVAPETASIEIRGLASGLLDDRLLLSARGGGPEAGLLWRGRFRDDDARIWRAAAPRAEELAGAWEPAKATTGPLPALQSLRPLTVDVRVEAEDGRAAGRALTRLLVGGGVRIRRWRDGELTATLCLPAGEPCAAVLIDATAGPRHGAVAALAAPLLASRGALALALLPPRAGTPSPTIVATAAERLAAVPSAAAHELRTLPVQDPLDPTPATAAGDVVVLPPGVPVRDEEPAVTAARAAAWDALLTRLGAQARS